MVDNPIEDSAYLKAREGLWINLQRHLNTLYDAEKQFNGTLILADSFPFNPNLVDSERLNTFLKYREQLRTLFIDETNQLESLIKALKQKNYREEDKKQLFLLILGYMDIAGSIFSSLEAYKPFSKEKDEELETTGARFDRLKKFVRLNIKGIMPKF